MTEEEVFDTFVAAHGTRLLRTAQLLAASPAAAEGLVRETLVRAWTSWRRVSTSDEPVSLVSRMLVEVSLGRGQRAAERTAVQQAPEDWLLAALPAKQRAAVVLSTHEGLSDAQVAEVLRTSTGTAASLRAKAVRTVHRRLADEAEEDEEKARGHAPGPEDVEGRLVRDLAARAAAAAPWPVSGADLRRVADGRRRRRRQILTATAATVAALVLGGLLLPSASPPDVPDREAVDPQPLFRTDPDAEASWRQVALAPDMVERGLDATTGRPSARLLVAVRAPGSDEVVTMFTRENDDGTIWAATATFDSGRPAARLRPGTGALYRSWSSIIAQPARAGDGSVLVVLLPSDLGDTVQATSSIPGKPVVRTSAFLRDRLALVPVRTPEATTRLQVVQRGRTVVDTIPAGMFLDAEVPRTLERVVADIDARDGQSHQVRTNGRIACRVTTGRYQGPVAVAWNPVHSACAELDGTLQLLLAPDRRHTTVAGVAPAAARRVRLHWVGGTVNEIGTSGGDVNAFLGPPTARADRLGLVDALDANGRVLDESGPDG